MRGAVSCPVIGRRLRIVSIRSAAPVIFVLAVAAGSFLHRLGYLSVDAVASSPHRIQEGKLWFLATSALLVDRPMALSLACFAALAAATLAVCGARLFWVTAVLGHVASTLLVYLLLAVLRAEDVDAFGAAMRSPDYGVSAISGAWLGAVAATAWQRRARSPAGRAAIAICCLAVGVFAYSVRPDVTVISSEHLVAFALGVAAATRSGLLRVRLAWSLEAAGPLSTRGLATARSPRT